MTWISYKRYRELIPHFPTTAEPPMADVAYADRRQFRGFGPTVRIRTPPEWRDWSETQFSLEDIEVWLAWDAERRLAA